MSITKAVVLAAGRGTRMQRAFDGEPLSPEQEQAAAAGNKALMPVGRPFLDYVLSALADAGITSVCIVVSSGASPVRERYESIARPARLRVEFAEQSLPIGTANALLAARQFVGSEAALVLNADNYYPVEALQAMVVNAAPSVAAFESDALVASGNVPRERLREFAILKADEAGFLVDLVEKPDSVDDGALVGMNLWAVTAPIIDACVAVERSVRGEHELPQAVRLALRERGVRVRCVRVRGAALDLSRRADVRGVAERFAGVDVAL